MAASSFTAVTLVLIREFAKMKMSPAEIIRKVNDTLSDNNPSMLFLTSAAGICDAGETLLLYPDGVNEAMNENKGVFGTKRLETVLGEWIS